ncbi:MAG: imidazole glycerol phosphate synthase subunit HisH, partial [Planctomycetota bacterium]
AAALAAVRERGLEAPIKDAIASGRPFLGVCLGLQMLLDTSHEDGVHRGLGVVPGDVVRFELPRELKVPHMGWNRVRQVRPCRLFDGIDDGEHFYFVHSYHAAVTDPEWVAAEADYGGTFCAAVSRGAAFATQFHPEKSQSAGLLLLKNFAELPVAAPA